MLMDPPVMQVECQLQNDVEKTSSIAYDRKHTLSHDDYGWQGSDIHPTSDVISCNPVEVNNSSRTGIYEKLDGSSEKSPVNLGNLPQGILSEPRKEKNGVDAYFNDVRFRLNVSAESNGSPSEDVNFNKQCVSKEDAHHSQDGMHPPPSTETVLRSCQSNGDALPSPDKKMTEEQANGDGNVDAESKEAGTDMEENETSVSPKNNMDMDQLVHNSCNGNANYEGRELDTGNVGEVEDNAVALWVKWRGKWQTGIRCCRVDRPLSTLKAKPTHDRKSYIVVFFPRTRTYSWVDMLLVCPIDEYPVPLVNGTHRKWRKLVKDLSIPRRFIMQKLAISMLNFSDELHTEAIIENARKATTWKEFALEASCCKDYTDLGKMLVKLQNVNPRTLFHMYILWNLLSIFS